MRSSYRLDTSIVRDSLIVDSIVDCQIHCLKSYKFTCRAFTFRYDLLKSLINTLTKLRFSCRYGPRVIGGAKENCQLTDWPYYEIDARTQLAPEPGFEMYERGSFGYGCEPDIRSKIKKAPLVKPNPNQRKFCVIIANKFCFLYYISSLLHWFRIACKAARTSNQKVSSC